MSTRHRTSHDWTTLRSKARTIAQQQGGVFTPADLESSGLDPDVVRTMVSRGIWRRLRHGVYTEVSSWQDTDGDPTARHLLECAGALRATKEPAFLFGTSAAAALALPWPRHVERPITLVRHRGADPRVLRRRSKHPQRLPDIMLKTHDLTPYQPTRVGGLPCVPMELAAVSAAAATPAEWAVAILDAASWQRPSMPSQLNDVHLDWPTLKGIGTVREILPMVRCGAQTPLESISRFRLVKRGVPEPVLQARFDDGDGLIGFGDMWWPTLGVIGEADGLLKYEQRSDLVAEKLREDRLRRLGYSVVRWTWREIMAAPDAVVARIWQAAADHSVRSAG